MGNVNPVPSPPGLKVAGMTGEVEHLREKNRRLRAQVRELRSSLRLAYEAAVNGRLEATRDTYVALMGEVS